MFLTLERSCALSLTRTLLLSFARALSHSPSREAKLNHKRETRGRETQNMNASRRHSCWVREAFMLGWSPHCLVPSPIFIDFTQGLHGSVCVCVCVLYTYIGVYAYMHTCTQTWLDLLHPRVCRGVLLRGAAARKHDVDLDPGLGSCSSAYYIHKRVMKG